MRALLLAALCVISTPLFADSLVGTYGVTGFDPSTGEPYQGKAEIKGEGDIYHITWNLPQEKEVYIGTGIRQGDKISVVFIEQRSPQDAGVQIYTINNDGTLSGKWVKLGKNKKGAETLKRLE